jgi:hypothetical protein
MRLFPLPPPEEAEPFEGDLPAAGSYFQARATMEGADFDAEAFAFLVSAGGTIEQHGGDVADVPIDAIVRGTNGNRFIVAAHGMFDDTAQSGLRRVDTVHKVGHRAVILHKAGQLPLLVITSHLPRPGSKGARYLARTGDEIFDVVGTRGDLAGWQRVHRYLTAAPAPLTPEPAPWRRELSQLAFGEGLGEKEISEGHA